MDKEMIGELELNRIYQRDCIEGMRMLPDNSIDLTVTSPPYDDLRTYKGFTFDFETTAKEIYRVTKDGGVVVWVVGDRTKNGSESGTSFRQALFFKEIGFNLHDTMIYAKKNYVPLTHNRYEQQFEYMFILSKGRPSVFNPIKEATKEAGRPSRLRHRKTGTGILDGSGKGKPVKREKIKPNIWFYGVGKGVTTTDLIAFNHPAIFPEKLAEDHITSWSKNGDIVLDPFMGSGTTAKMAALNDRKFLGFEISEEYVRIANERLVPAKEDANDE
ncbi:DNA-methyltransferase [Bacillus nakamurai]|uniref:DNA-methyltransferase n=1 Tax=Bacillus nakamurai TaxID=1793963 RepID=UPI0020C42883|nr:site-specific DNA-methyltransferase [Bacillus nakamurai]MCP6682965.1 site-specific DNA-methyltransferase [Bacillus nakamurai]